MSSDKYLEGPVVVFGANGFLGAAIVRELLRVARKNMIPSPRIVAIVRSSDLGPSLGALAPYVEVKRCDHITEDSLNDVLYNTLKGDVRAFMHVAGLVRHTSDPDTVREMYAANVQLSNTIFGFAEKHGIRTIYASTSGVVGCQFIEDKLRVAHDDGPLCQDTIAAFPYYQQKAEIERYWRPRAASGKVPIVFMRPSLLLGPGDDRLSSSKPVLDFIQGRMTFMPQGGISFMDVRDCAAAFVTAMLCDETAVGGTALNLTACNIPYSEFGAMLEEVSGVQAPKIELPGSLARVGGKLATSLTTITGRERDDGHDPVYVEVRQRFWNVTCQRALQLLEFDPRDPIATLKDASRYLHHTYGDAQVSRARQAAATSSMVDGNGPIEAAMKRRSPAILPLASGANSGRQGVGYLAGTRRANGIALLTRKRLLAVVALLVLLVMGFMLAPSSGPQ